MAGKWTLGVRAGENIFQRTGNDTGFAQASSSLPNGETEYSQIHLKKLIDNTDVPCFTK